MFPRVISCPGPWRQGFSIPKGKILGSLHPCFIPVPISASASSLCPWDGRWLWAQTCRHHIWKKHLSQIPSHFCCLMLGEATLEQRTGVSQSFGSALTSPRERPYEAALACVRLVGSWSDSPSAVLRGIQMVKLGGDGCRCPAASRGNRTSDASFSQKRENTRTLKNPSFLKKRLSLPGCEHFYKNPALQPASGIQS